MTDIGLNHVANVIKGLVILFVSRRKLKHHNSECIQKVVNFFGSFKSHIKPSFGMLLYNQTNGRKVEFSKLEQY